MWQTIFTKSCDNADDIEAKVFDYAQKEDAIACFNEMLQSLVEKAIDNEHLDCKLSIHKRKALFKIEGSHYTLAVVKDGGIL